MSNDVIWILFTKISTINDWEKFLKYFYESFTSKIWKTMKKKWEREFRRDENKWDMFRFISSNSYPVEIINVESRCQSEKSNAGKTCDEKKNLCDQHFRNVPL